MAIDDGDPHEISPAASWSAIAIDIEATQRYERIATAQRAAADDLRAAGKADEARLAEERAANARKRADRARQRLRDEGTTPL